MGTLVSMTAMASTDQAANRAIDAGLKEVKRLEQLLRTWIPESEMSRVKALAGKTLVPVGLETLTVVQHAVQAAERTGGGFNVMMWGSHAPNGHHKPLELAQPTRVAVVAPGVLRHRVTSWGFRCLSVILRCPMLHVNSDRSKW